MRRPKLFARFPPAVFSVVLGLFGLGLAGRLFAKDTVLAGVVEGALGMILGLWLLAMLGFAIKVVRRPRVLLEDLRVLPGRSGIAASSMAGMAAAIVLLPFSTRLAAGVLIASICLHALFAATLIFMMARSPSEARQVNPVWHQSFVGFIVGAVAAAQMGANDLASWVLTATLPVAAIVWGVSLAQLLRLTPPAPLRPLLAIHLAPAALFATVALSLGQHSLAVIFALIGLGILIALLAAMRWITASGFSALWGAFTFPVTAFAATCLQLGGLWRPLGLILLGLATVLVPWIAYNVLKMWATGSLAIKTNAAEA